MDFFQVSGSDFYVFRYVIGGHKISNAYFFYIEPFSYLNCETTPSSFFRRTIIFLTRRLPLILFFFTSLIYIDFEEEPDELILLRHLDLCYKLPLKKKYISEKFKRSFD